VRISIPDALSVIALLAASVSAFACSTDDTCRGDSCNDSGKQSTTMDSADECPIDEPAEGDPCTEPGRVCPASGSLSCPAHATCSGDGHWRIGCPLTAVGVDAPCTCPHPGE
jgi:hypothetical protein